LPVYFLWPLSTQTATLLCRRCNGEKAEQWPSTFYSDTKLRELAVKTGLSYNLLSGAPSFNPEALENLQNAETVDTLLTKFAPYIERELIPLRNRILRETGIDFFASTPHISDVWIRKADERL
jgi:hypothetical protein